MKPKEYAVLQYAVELGVSLGWNRAHKHVDEPTADQIKEAIERAVTNEITEWFDFEPTSQDVLAEVGLAVSRSVRSATG